MLNQQEVKHLVALLKKIDKPHEGLPQPVFEALVGVVPFIACELIVVDDKRGLLLTWRSDKYWRGYHFPGGLLRYNEGFDERIQAVAGNELEVHIKGFKFICPFNYTNGIRGHCVSLVFLCRTEMKPKTGKFFKIMPRNIIEEHKGLWQRMEKVKSVGLALK